MFIVRILSLLNKLTRSLNTGWFKIVFVKDTSISFSSPLLSFIFAVKVSILSILRIISIGIVLLLIPSLDKALSFASSVEMFCLSPSISEEDLLFFVSPKFTVAVPVIFNT